MLESLTGVANSLTSWASEGTGTTGPDMRSFAEKYGESILSGDNRRRQDLMDIHNLKMGMSRDRMFRSTEHQIRQSRGEDPISAPTVAQSFQSPTGAGFKAQMLRV